MRNNVRVPIHSRSSADNTYSALLSTGPQTEGTSGSLVVLQYRMRLEEGRSLVRRVISLVPQGGRDGVVWTVADPSDDSSGENIAFYDSHMGGEQRYSRPASTTRGGGERKGREERNTGREARALHSLLLPSFPAAPVA